MSLLSELLKKKYQGKSELPNYLNNTEQTMTTNTAQQNEQEARGKKRYELSQVVRVHDTFTDVELGSLVNINPDGLMLVSNQKIDSNRIYQIKLLLPENINGTQSTDVVIDCLWSKSAGAPGVHWAGCAIIDADEQASEIIETLIENYGK